MIKLCAGFLLGFCCWCVSPAYAQLLSGGGGSARSLYVFPESFGAVADAKVQYDGTIANGSSTLTAEGFATVNGNQTLPESTLTINTNPLGQWNQTGSNYVVVVDGNTVTCTGVTTPFNYQVTAFTGCTGGSGAISNGDAVTQAHSVFKAADAGKAICVGGISGVYGPTGSGAFGPVPQSELCGTISSYTSASQVTVNFSSANGAVVHGVSYRYGTDNTTAMQNALNSCAANGCTIGLTGSYAITNSLSIPYTAPVNIVGTSSYAPDANISNSHITALGSGVWVLSKSLANAALIYGGTSGGGAVIQNISYELRNFNLVGGSGPSVCTGAGCNGYFGTLDGGGSDGVLVNGVQGVSIYGVDVSNFAGDCLRAAGSNIEFIRVDHVYWNYCGSRGFEDSGAGSFNAQMMVTYSDIENMGLDGIYFSGNTAAEYGDTGIIVIGSTLQWNGVRNAGAYYQLNITGGRDTLVMGNWFEGGGGGSALACLNSPGTGGDASGGGSSLWISNHYPSVATNCDTVQWNTQASIFQTLPACVQALRGRENWVEDGVTGCTYGSTYTASAGSAVCKVGCNGTNWLYGW